VFVLFLVTEPKGKVIEKYAVAGDNITLKCSVDYHGPETPYIEWTDDSDNIVNGASEWLDTDNETNPDTVIYVRVSELEVFVPEAAKYAQPYTCSVKFYSYYQRPYPRRYYHYNYRGYYSYNYYDNVFTQYNWTSPEIKLSCK